jgi:uncharacterized cupin superfamily protein
MSKSIVMATPATVELAPASIPADWILSGTPTAWNKEVARSHDRISQIVVWECTEGHFKWHYSKDESVIVVSGEAFLVNDDGRELRFGLGDVGFFPAGSTCTWRVPGRFRKVAVIREPMWRPLGFAVKAWNRLLSIAGVNRTPRLTLVSHESLSETPRQVG